MADEQTPPIFTFEPQISLITWALTLNIIIYSYLKQSLQVR